MNAPRVSVCLPCHDAAATLPRALESLLAQTLTDFEIVAVDDGSTDATGDILADCARRDSRLRPIRIAHSGVALAFAQAVGASRAPYIARMDADDQCPPNRLAAQAELLDADPALDVVSGLVRFGGDRQASRGYALHVDWLNTLISHEDIALSRFVESPLCNPSTMFRRASWERFGGPRKSPPGQPFPEDYEMWLRWLELGARIGKVSEEVLIWHDPPTRLTRTHADYSDMAFATIRAKYLWRWLARRNPAHPCVHVWGAGRVSRQRLAPLSALGLEISAYIDIDARKIGQRVHGVPVLSRETLPAPDSPDAPFLLVNVGSRGAREEIREWLEERGWKAGEGFMVVG